MDYQANKISLSHLLSLFLQHTSSNEILYFLKSGNLDKLSAMTDQLAEEGNRNRYYLYLLDLVFAMQKLCDSEQLTSFLRENPLEIRFALLDSEAKIRNDILHFTMKAHEFALVKQKLESELLCERVAEIIEIEYHNPGLKLSGIAKRLNVSPNYLSALIKKIKRQNFVDFLTEKRMEAAYHLVTGTGMRIYDIAEMCGYREQHYFSTSFKKRFGLSPSELRTEMKKQDFPTV